MLSTIENNIAKVCLRIREAEQKFQRPPHSVQLMAVSKTRSSESIRQAAACGITDIGENYLQEALEKIAALQDLALTWHFIGPIQSNKTRAIAEHFHWVHSVDRLKIARRLSEARGAELAPLNICLQVNISNESSKSGFKLSELTEAAAAISQLPNIKLRGLMAIPKAFSRTPEQRQALAPMAQALAALQEKHPGMDTLSMGMSGDLTAAVAEGASIVRIGTDIFGPR